MDGRMEELVAKHKGAQPKSAAAAKGFRFKFAG